MKPLYLAIALSAVLATACSEAVLVFPEPTPARVRIVNTSQDVDPLTVVIDSSQTVDVARGATSGYRTVPAGRPISFVLQSAGTTIGRDTAYYTLGPGGSLILFARGSRARVVRFLSPLQDTVPPTGDPACYVKFTHAVEYDFISNAEFVDVFLSTGERLFPETYPPDITSPRWAKLAPGSYTFVIRQAGSGAELARTATMQLTAGQSYVLYTYDRTPPTIDDVGVVLE